MIGEVGVGGGGEVGEGVVGDGPPLGELGEVVRGTLVARQSPDDITIFKSLGLAVEDVAAADLVYRRAVAGGTGIELVL